MSYSLQIVSQGSATANKTFKKHSLNKEEVIGVVDNEPFEILFTNYAWGPVQVKISIDGLDILTGELADTTTSGQMWFVGAKQTLRLKAYPETNESGAQFIFTHAKNGVAGHLHGDFSSRGIIAAAVYTEDYVYPQWRLNNHSSNIIRSRSSTSGNSSFGFNETSGSINIPDSRNDDLLGSVYPASFNSTADSYSANATKSSRSLESLAAVGAGQQVQQNITSVSGLKKPKLQEIVKVKYMFWDQLKAKLEDQAFKAAEATNGSGFPGDRKQILNLKSVPRLEGETASPAIALQQEEFNRF